MLSDQAIKQYLEPLNPDQTEGITAIRRLIFEYIPSAVEAIDEGKWSGGLLTYNRPDGVFLYALGPRKDGSTTFHMMPYYALPDLQKRYGNDLKKFLTGKSCIKFKRFSDLPQDALRGILGSMDSFEDYARQLLEKQKKARPAGSSSATDGGVE